MNWESLDWEVLDRLRGDFLSGAAAGGPYWHTLTDLECYDFTFGERIGWKWDAVLGELQLHGWTPCRVEDPARVERGPGRAAGATLLDWGCGSGIAGRRVADFYGAANFARLLLHDHSALAMDFAEHRAHNVFPQLAVERASARFLRGDEPFDVLVVSHVLNELDEAARTELRALAARAGTILWVEPGTHEVSRALGGWRERLRGQFRAVAPCPHQATCGVLTPGNERHWCHFFAPSPAGIHADSGWVKFGQRAGIDLRSLPYSFLVLDQRPVALAPSSVGPALAAGPFPSTNRPTAEPVRQAQGPEPVEGRRPYMDHDEAEPGFSRIIGEPRHYKGYAKIFGCAEDGVAELTLQKRDAPDVFKALKHAEGPLVYRWTRNGDRVTDVVPRF